MGRTQKALCWMIVAIFALLGESFAQSRATVTIRLNETLSSDSSQAGDSFTGTLDAPLVIEGRIVADNGTRVIGRVIDVVSSGRLKTPAELSLRLQTVEAERSIPVRTGDLTIKAGSHAGRNLLIIGGSAALGSAIGASAGGGKATAIGAAAGAGSGAVGAYLSGKREIVLPSETRLRFHVNSVEISPAELAQLQRSAKPEQLEAEQVIYRVHGRGRDHEDDHDDDDDDDDDDDHRWRKSKHRHIHVHRDGYEYEYVVVHHAKKHKRGHAGCRRYYHHPRVVEVVFHRQRRATVVISWPQRVERLTFDGDDLEDIIQPLSVHTRVSIDILRPKIRVKRDD